MNKVASRLLIFFIGIPIVIAFIVAPFCNHILLHILVCVISALGASELYDIFSAKYKLLNKKLIIAESIFIPIVAALYAILPSLGISFYSGQEIITFAYIVTILISFTVEVFSSKEFEESNARLASSIFIITYTGFLLTFISRMTTWTLDGKNITVPVVCVFILMVFMCDSIAWFLGVLFGKSNRGIVKASPNKSCIGFLGGFIGSVGAGILGYYLWPQIFSGSVLKIIFTGLCMALSSIVGDLTESVFKRSSGIKDSGKIIPGRGGILDSIDSIVVSAPIFYLLVSILFGPFN
ncbi:MAG: phosphatidate cytidylyltransferase [Treponema sp.]|uniref:phosphatidate cytidylyltransferase n=1 Tax=Treponema sp. TaxID=166 RepID=UPI00280A66D9|nr:phosphatidate cytidylyltransferase [uncultured Treponema sp.]MEE0352451.1 phosphatidate cytidylyltransferase [Treponema sp.]